MELIEVKLLLGDNDAPVIVHVYEDDQGARWEAIMGAYKVEDKEDE